MNLAVPEVESAIIACSATKSSDSIDNLKNKLENVKISDFPGEIMSKISKSFVIVSITLVFGNTTYSISFVRSTRLSVVKNFAHGISPI